MTSPTAEKSLPQPADATAYRVARLLRHEIGDLLQSLYSTVAILVERLPTDMAAERRLLIDLKGRAELCKLELDAVVDLLAVPQSAPSALDLTALVGAALFQVRRRFAALDVRFSGGNLPPIVGDSRSLPAAFGFFLTALCQGAKAEVNLELDHSAGAVRCRVERDGFAPGNEAAWLEQPFATTQQALLGLGLALLKRVIEPHGGGITLAGRTPTGVCLELSFPVKEV
jgi:signal transduction histidine kinase